jgi:hypothetical protein
VDDKDDDVFEVAGTPKREIGLGNAYVVPKAPRPGQQVVQPTKLAKPQMIKKSDVVM